MGRQLHSHSSDSGRLAICESWASHLEHMYTDREFGETLVDQLVG